MPELDTDYFHIWPDVCEDCGMIGIRALQAAVKQLSLLVGSTQYPLPVRFTPPKMA